MSIFLNLFLPIANSTTFLLGKIFAGQIKVFSKHLPDQSLAQSLSELGLFYQQDPFLSTWTTRLGHLESELCSVLLAPTASRPLSSC